MGSDVLHPDDSPPPDVSSRPRDASAGCIVALAAAILLPLFLYVGSFLFLILDGQLGWGVMSALDGRELETLRFIYWPLIWLVDQVL